MDKRLFKRGVLVLGAVPMALILAGAVMGTLGANPVENVMNRLGFWAITFLTLSLVPTPLKILFGLKKPLQVRRMLGLYAFTYALLHFLTYVVADQALDVDDIWKDVTKRPFITVGFAAFVLLIPLAVTSTEKSVQKLGFRRWNAIHRLVYVCAVLTAVHFWLRVKSDYLEPGIFAAAITFLLVVRVVDWLRRRKR